MPRDTIDASCARSKILSSRASDGLGRGPEVSRGSRCRDLPSNSAARARAPTGTQPLVSGGPREATGKESQIQKLVSERMDAVNVLAQGVAHEINNPLASVLANLDYAVDELTRSSASSVALPEVVQALAEAHEEALRVKAAIRDLQTISRSDQLELNGPVDVHRVLESVLHIAAGEFLLRARLVKEFGAIPAVMGTDALLGQVFLNLIAQAVLAMPASRRASNELRVVTKSIGTRAAIEIHDTGPGLSAAGLEKLFTPYFTLRQAPGTGRGLAICAHIVSRLGGEFRVESRSGCGTTFIVILPAATVTPAGVATPQRALA